MLVEPRPFPDSRIRTQVINVEFIHEAGGFGQALEDAGNSSSPARAAVRICVRMTHLQRIRQDTAADGGLSAVEQSHRR